MEILREYAVSVVSAAFITGIVLSLFQNSKAEPLVKLVCGVFMAVTVLLPITRFDFSQISQWDRLSSQDAQEAVSLGENISADAMRRIIKEETEAYILDKAADLRAPVSVKVVVSTDTIPVPVSVSISGNISPYVRGRLSSIIEEDLGIAKEDQLWTG